MIKDPPGGYGLPWYVDRWTGSEWEEVGGFKAGPVEHWQYHAKNRFYFNPKWSNVGIEDIGFGGPTEIALTVPALEPGRYRLSGQFYGKRTAAREFHFTEFEVIAEG